ncbi:MAG TPA: tRNA uridine-5-carboxymethylaminomethyl(34) synthesis GTPase MnmE [Vicinamibacterales bacterium]|jgi:tRNA modification GTPase
MSFSPTDTIVAIATPPGRGGIGVVRVSGPAAPSIAHSLIDLDIQLEPRRATFTRTADLVGIRDEIIVTMFPAPHSYTGDDVVELSAHGSPVVLRAIVASAISRGARLAEPGEFTLRAFLNGRIDLMQAEAVRDLIDAVTPLQARAAFDQLEGTLTRTIAELDATLFDLIAKLEASIDFPDEGYHFIESQSLGRELDALLNRTSQLLADAQRGRIVREGLQVAIIGAPNVGKSSLFNALVGADRAIVTDTPGTTRDLVTESVDIGGVRVTFIDTAGIRSTADGVEAEGIARSRQVQSVADLVLVVVDNDEPEPMSLPHLLVQSKIDLDRPHRGVRVSARTGEGVDNLRSAILSALDVAPTRDRPEITNIRHATLLSRAHDALTRARSAVGFEGEPLSEEFVLIDLQIARDFLEEITGRRTSDELLGHVFSRFCVGK